MTSRQTGLKISQMYNNQTGYRPKRRKGSSPLTSTEKLRLAQFLICGTIFVALVAVKLILPARIEWLSQHVNGLLERNMNVTEVFSAAGRAFSGKGDDSWEELYQSVFHPEHAEAVPTTAQASIAVPETTYLEVPQDTLHSKNGWLKDPPMKDIMNSPEKTSESTKENGSAGDSSADSSQSDGAAQAQPDGAQKLSYILYSNKTLPQNVSLEQKVLGFDYCTPVMGVLSSDFGYREHPVEGEEKFHYGVDIAADEGTTIECFANGSVTAVGESTSYGKYAIIAHKGGFSTLYAHCKKVTTSSGSVVKEGQKIAEVGHTGEATGSHLHFEIRDGDTYLDPIYYVSLP